jgi:hypothetical protein
MKLHESVSNYNQDSKSWMPGCLKLLHPMNTFWSIVLSFSVIMYEAFYDSQLAVPILCLQLAEACGAL